MKKFYKYIAMFFVGVSVLASCTDESEIMPVEKNEPERAVVKLGFQRQADKEVNNSRATEAENKLYDLHFYVFNKAGDLTGYTKMESADGALTSPGPASVTIEAMTGESYIYSVANINKSTTYYLSNDDKQLLNVMDVASSTLTRDAFLNIQFQRMHGTEGSELFSPDPTGDIFVMSGYLNDGNAVNIRKDAAGNVSIAEGVNTIYLYRILAKNTFTITSGKDKGTFTPKYYRLCNVPVSGTLIPKAGISTPATYLAGNVTTANVESSYRWNFNGLEVIEFYYPENLQVAKNSTIGSWENREKNAWNGATKTFTNAADNAAYIEIYGDFVDNTGEVTANVNYTIHFGDFSSNNWTDFNVIRNYSYKYKVTVNGVDDIKVEATTSDDHPYAEGLIVDATGGEHYDVDAHYEARVMTFKKSTIQALREAGSGYILSIKTPFGETKETVNVKADGVFDMQEELLCTLDNVASLFNNEADYQWMKFVKNTTSNRINNGADISKNVCKYPGDDSKAVLNVFELLAALYSDDAYTENNNTEVYYTCFIDENYYANKTWPEYVDKESRSMLIANDLDVSADGKSLYAKVAYSVSQRSISTFYQRDYIYPDNTNDLVKAFGTEIIDEEKVYNKRFSNSDYSGISNQHDWNGWTSASSTNQNGDWYSNMESVTGAQPLYTTVAKACMSRNRDSDGDGTIDGNEVKWYLATVDQYRALFFGQNALDQDSYLITRAELEDIDNANWGNDQYGHSYRRKYHYFTSSANDKSTFWPEEGLTNNPYNNSYSWAELVRCVRTLESGTKEQPKMGLTDPERFYTYKDNTFELGGIVATRNYTEEPLPYHNEIQPANNLYSSFVVAENDLISSTGQWNANNNFALNDITNGADPCVNYKTQSNVRGTAEANYSWRTPNQKEFGLMVSRLPDGQYGTRTRFSGDDAANGYWNWHNTPGFWSDSGGGGRINVGTGHEGGVRIRCVRDKK